MIAIPQVSVITGDPPGGWSRTGKSTYRDLFEPLLRDLDPGKTAVITAEDQKRIHQYAAHVRTAARSMGLTVRTVSRIGSAQHWYLYVQIVDRTEPKPAPPPKPADGLTAIQRRQAADPDRTAEIRAAADRRNSEVRPKVVCRHCGGEYVAVEKERGQWHPYVHRIVTPAGRVVCPGCDLPGAEV